jgi:cell division protein FtsW (lipid II flippase)
MLFGLAAASAYVGLIIVLGSIVSLLSSKVQDRVMLMVDPMNAPVNDFARLIAFANAHGTESWFPLIPWCNDRGLCLPLQVLSDYIPTLLLGLIGHNGVIFYGLLLMAVLALTLFNTMKCFLISIGPDRVLASVCFFLILSMLTQIVINFAGNWRLLPLTGVGIPLISIGITSSLTACATLGLSIRLLSKHRRL